jgi:hypothetical protein
MFASLRTMAACAAVATLALAVPAQGADVGNHATFKSQSVDFGNGRAYHIYQTPEQMRKSGHFPSLGPSGQMEYFGGGVFSTVKVVSVLWGPNVNKTWVAGLPGYFTALTNSTFVDQLGEYSTKGAHSVNHHKGTNQTIARGTYLGQVQITPKNKGTSLTDDMVQDELAYQIGKGVLPKNDANTVYMTYFPPGVSIHLFHLTSCQQFGAYHEAVDFALEKTNIFYAVEPDCSYTFNNQTIVSAHEFAEATTDNVPVPGSHPRFPQAWNTSAGSEIGDLCEGTSGTLTAGKNSYLVQQVYLNSTGACSTGNYTSP